jgi:hypothetical protein
MKTITVRMTEEQARVIQFGLDRLSSEIDPAVTSAPWRAKVYLEDGEAFDIVPPPPPLEAHEFRARKGARLYAVPGGDNSNYRVGHAEGGVGGWYYDAECCDEAAEWFQMLARELRERE